MVLIIHSIKILETIPHQVSRGQMITNQKRWLLKTLYCMIQISVYQKPQKVIQTNHCLISKVQIAAKTMGKDSNIILTVTLFSAKNVSNRSQRSIRGMKSKVDGLGSKRTVPGVKLDGPKDLKSTVCESGRS